MICLVDNSERNGICESGCIYHKRCPIHWANKYQNGLGKFFGGKNNEIEQ